MLVAVMAALTVGAAAEDTIVTDNGVKYNITTGTVVGPVKKDNVISITIRSSVNGNEINTIAADAFNGCGKLTTVEMESGIKVIGASAFNSCPLLQSISLPDSISTIGDYAFANCGRLNNVVLPTILKDIQTGTFANCGSLKSIYIATVSHIFPSAFSGSGVEFLHRDTADGLKQDDTPELPVHVTTRIPGLKTDPTCILQGKQTYSYNCTAGCGSKFNFSQSRPLPALGHLPGDLIPEVPATCSTDGTTEGHRCIRTGCNGVADGLVLIPRDPKDPSKHNKTLEIVAGKDATCTEPGLTEGKRCPDCGTMVEKQTETSKIEHKYETKTVPIREATCSEEGLKGTFQICSVCGTAKECEDCEKLKDNQEKYEQHIKDSHNGQPIDKKDHTPGAAAYVVTKDPDCTNTGTKEWKFVCTICKKACDGEPDDALDHLPQEVPALGHDLAGGIETITKQPTCTESGEKTVSAQKCKREGCTFEKGEQTDVEVDPLGHDLTAPVDKINAVSATCKKEGEDWLNFRECKRKDCDYEEKTVVKKIGAHSWEDPKADPDKESEDKAPTCGEAGESHVIVTCSVCQKTEAQTIAIPATGEHSWGEWETREPTETQDGEQKRICTVCEKEDVIILPATKDPSKPDDPDDPDEPEESKTYQITLVQGVGGAVSASRSTAKAGDTVTLTILEESGYELDMLRVTDGSRELSVSNSSGDRYRFTMPAANVEVRVTFERINSSGWSGSNWASAPGEGSDGDPRRTADIMPTQNPSQSVPRAGAWNQLFQDIPTSHWAAGEIAWANQMGFMNGSGGRFNPDGAITHQQMWMVLARLTGSRPANMEEARRWAVQGGFADGSSPNGAVTRHQLVTALYRCAHLMGSTNRNTTSLAGYADSRTVPTVAREAFSWAVANGIVGGTASGRLDPNGTLTRAQFAVILYRYSQRI